MSVPVELLPRYKVRNWIGFLGDYVTFGLGLTFASTTTTLPAFAATLTENKLLIGAVSAVWMGGWLLPQVFAAHYLSNKPRKYPIMMWGQILFRPVFPLFVVWLLVGGTRYPGLTLAFLLITLAIFAVSDALVALAWLDLFGKALPAGTRGRLIGVGQVITGVAAVGAGVWIRHLLGPEGPAYPMNYAIIIGLATVCYFLSILACAVIVEPHESVPEDSPSLREYFPLLARLMRDDPAFRRVTIVRLLAGLGGMATPFYVVYATQTLQLPESSIGLFAGATTLGTAVAGVLLGTLADRRGTHRVIQISTGVAACVPLFVLLLTLPALRTIAATLYPILYVMLGMFEGSLMLGFLNFVLDIAPAGKRPVYLGLANTLAGLLIPAPLIGGFILERTSFNMLFGLTAAGILAGALLAIGLPNPRHGKTAPEFEASPHLTTTT